MKRITLMIFMIVLSLFNQLIYADNPKDKETKNTQPSSPAMRNTQLFTLQNKFDLKYKKTLDKFSKYKRSFVNKDYFSTPNLLPVLSFENTFAYDIWGNRIEVTSSEGLYASGGTGNNTASPFIDNYYDPTKPPSPSSGTGNNYNVPKPSSGTGNNFASTFGPANGGDFKSLKEKAIIEGKFVDKAKNKKDKNLTVTKIKLIRQTLIDLLENEGDTIYPDFEGKYFYKEDKDPSKITKENGEAIKEGDVVSLKDIISTLKKDDIFKLARHPLRDRYIRRVDATNFPKKGLIKFPASVKNLFHWRAPYILALHEIMNLHDVEVYDAIRKNDKFIESFKAWDYVHKYLPCTYIVSNSKYVNPNFIGRNTQYEDFEEEYYSVLETKIPRKISGLGRKDLFPRKCSKANHYTNAAYEIIMTKIINTVEVEGQVIRHENHVILINGVIALKTINSFFTNGDETGNKAPTSNEALDIVVEEMLRQAEQRKDQDLN